MATPPDGPNVAAHRFLQSIDDCQFLKKTKKKQRLAPWKTWRSSQWKWKWKWAGLEKNKRQRQPLQQKGTRWLDIDDDDAIEKRPLTRAPSKSIANTRRHALDLGQDETATTSTATIPKWRLSQSPFIERLPLDGSGEPCGSSERSTASVVVVVLLWRNYFSKRKKMWRCDLETRIAVLKTEANKQPKTKKKQNNNEGPSVQRTRRGKHPVESGSNLTPFSLSQVAFARVEPHQKKHGKNPLHNDENPMEHYLSPVKLG